MAIALVAGSVKVYPLVAEVPFRGVAPQVLECQVTAAASDTSFNLGTVAAAGGDQGEYITSLLAKADKILGYYFLESDQAPRAGGVQYYTADATAGGGATESLTVTGLAVGDVVLAAQRVSGGNAVSVVGYGAVGANSLASVVFSADPGAGALVKVAVLKAATAPIGSNHVFSGTAAAPVFTFAGGTSTPTTLTLCMIVKLKPDVELVNNQGV